MSKRDPNQSAKILEAEKKYYEEIPYETARIKAAMQQANEEFKKGDIVGRYKIVGSQVFLRPDGRLSFRAKRVDQKKAPTRWVSLHTLRAHRKKDKL